MIGIVYTGLPRFQAETQENHNRLINRLLAIAPVQIHDCLQPHFDRSDLPCNGTVGAAGGIQVWDFMKAAQHMIEPIIIKFRTDLWFCESSIEVVAREVETVLNGDADVVYMGTNLKENFDKKDLRFWAAGQSNVPDYVVIARREKVLDIDRVRDSLTLHKDNVASGNKVFKIITPDLLRSYCVNCHIYLVREQLPDMNDWTVGWSFMASFAKIPEDAIAYMIGIKPNYIETPTLKLKHGKAKINTL